MKSVSFSIAGEIGQIYCINTFSGDFMVNSASRGTATFLQLKKLEGQFENKLRRSEKNCEKKIEQAKIDLTKELEDAKKSALGSRKQTIAEAEVQARDEAKALVVEYEEKTVSHRKKFEKNKTKAIAAVESILTGGK